MFITSTIESFNKHLFIWLNATPNTPDWLIELARFVSKDLILVIPVLLITFWLWGKNAVGNINGTGITKIHKDKRVLVIKTNMALFFAIVMCLCIRTFFYYPRPFSIELGHQFLSHKASASFPSKHGTMIFTTALAFLLWHHLFSGLCLLLIAISIAWSRIFLGVHWPADMLGAACLAPIACFFAHLAWRICGQALLERLTKLYQAIFKFPIKKGWIQP